MLSESNTVRLLSRYPRALKRLVVASPTPRRTAQVRLAFSAICNHTQPQAITQKLLLVTKPPRGGVDRSSCVRTAMASLFDDENCSISRMIITTGMPA
jgi:hypothetical protein